MFGNELQKRAKSLTNAGGQELKVHELQTRKHNAASKAVHP